MAEHPYLKWLTSQTQSLYWHDSAVHAEKERAFADGAVGMTTNPFLINATLRGDKSFWTEQLKQVEKGLTGDAKALALVHAVTGFYAQEVRPIFDRGEIGKGYVCAQTNPSKTGDAEYMIQQAKTLASWAPNIVVKLPATNAGITAYEECVAQGLNVAATVSFTVPQVLAVGEAAERGYTTFLMPAGCRGTNHVTEFAGAKMIMSIAPKIVNQLALDTPQEERIDVPVAADVIERLMTMAEFRKAYLEDGMTREEFITFGSANRTTDQFINDGWAPLLSYEY